MGMEEERKFLAGLSQNNEFLSIPSLHQGPRHQNFVGHDNSMCVHLPLVLLYKEITEEIQEKTEL